MINSESLTTNEHDHVLRNDGMNLILAPHTLLLPYIANYTFCNPKFLPEQQMVLPSVSTTLVYSVGNNEIFGGLRGVNTKPVNIGNYAGQFDFLFLIEFHSAGLYPFLKIDQNYLLNGGFSFDDLDSRLNKQIIEAYLSSDSISLLKEKLDYIFLLKLNSSDTNPLLTYAMEKIIRNKGLITTKALADDVHYSNKQLNRLFQKHIGTGIKTFSRIVRIKYAADLLTQSLPLSQIAEYTGHYDPSHFVRDFKEIYNCTPSEYVENMSLLYNDPFKLNGYNKGNYNLTEREELLL